MKTTPGFLFVGGLLTIGSLFALAACGDETGTTSGSTSTSSSSGSESASSSSGSGSGSGGGSSAKALTCEYYCKTIDAANGSCTGDNDQYEDSLANACMKTCAVFNEGKLDETTGDTLGCRIYHAEVAGMAGNAEAHCPHAGPFGDGQCGTDPCSDFCAIATKICTGANKAFDDEATCMKECNAFAATPKYSVKETAGNTFACRAYHLTAASVAPGTHCPHIKTMSDTCK